MDNCGYFSVITEKFIIDSVAANSVRHIFIVLVLNYSIDSKKTGEYCSHLQQLAIPLLVKKTIK